MYAYRWCVARAVAGLLGGALAAACAVADEGPVRPSGLMSFPGVKVERAPVARAAGAARAHDARVYVDPATGMRRERTPEDAAAEASTAAAPAPELVRGPNGIVGVRMRANAAVYSVVTRGGDGRLVRECVDDPARATRAATPARAPVAARTDER